MIHDMFFSRQSRPRHPALSPLGFSLGSAALGALMMYALDPEQGRRRRALARDKARSLTGQVEDAVSVTARDLRNRARGTVAEIRSGRRDGPPRLDLLQRNWAPATRFLVALGGSAIAFYGGRRRGLLGAALGSVGGSAIARAITNTGFGRMVGVGGDTAIVVQKTIEIEAPLETVFTFWSAYENFPRVMSNVREVRDLGGERSHWVVAGPGGVAVEWDAMLTRFEPNAVIAWTSAPDAAVRNAGVVRFYPIDLAVTRVDLRLEYHPPGGVLGDAMARLFGADPKSEMDADLQRVKSYLESGVPPHDAAARAAADAAARTDVPQGGGPAPRARR